MTLLTQKNRSLLPSVVSDFFNAERFLGPSLLDFNGNLFDKSLALIIPDANIRESNKDYTVELAAPGLERKDFKIEVEGDLLTISSEKKEETKEEAKDYVRREFSYNAFNRTFALPENCLSDKIEAKYDAGILRLTIPKKEVTVTKAKKEIKVA